jgi:Holliday junction resolvase
MGAGDDKERKVREHFESRGWWVCRAAGSLGDADLVMLRVQRTKGRVRAVERLVWLVEVKANRKGGPFSNFRKADREELKIAARLAGAEAWLAYWPAYKPLRMIHESEWPE